jgi:hypothetical protein
MRDLSEIVQDNDKAAALFKKNGTKIVPSTCSGCLQPGVDVRLRPLPGYPVLCDSCDALQMRPWTPAR